MPVVLCDKYHLLYAMKGEQAMNKLTYFTRFRGGAIRNLSTENKDAGVSQARVLASSEQKGTWFDA